jgi:hypothetical protein
MELLILVVAVAQELRTLLQQAVAAVQVLL